MLSMPPSSASSRCYTSGGVFSGRGDELVDLAMTDTLLKRGYYRPRSTAEESSWLFSADSL